MSRTTVGPFFTTCGDGTVTVASVLMGEILMGAGPGVDIDPAFELLDDICPSFHSGEAVALGLLTTTGRSVIIVLFPLMIDGDCSIETCGLADTILGALPFKASFSFKESIVDCGAEIVTKSSGVGERIVAGIFLGGLPLRFGAGMT
jgi:hypothetical protein